MNEQEKGSYFIERVDNLTALEQDFYDYQKDHDSILGWLLMLTDKEFEEVWKSFYELNDQGEMDGSLAVISLTKGNFIPGVEISRAELVKGIQLWQENVTVIKYCRSKELRYTKGPTDADWRFNPEDVMTINQNRNGSLFSAN